MRDTAGGRIFLSYRRDDTRYVAGRLADRLAERFGQANVFMDVDSIEPGLDFRETIERAVGACDVLLALIGTRWLHGTDEHGRRRLDDPDDLVLLEIKSALDRDIRVVPVLVDGAAAPSQDDLPEALAPLARRNAVRLNHETFRTNVGPLIDMLDRALRSTSPTATRITRPRLPVVSLSPRFLVTIVVVFCTGGAAIFGGQALYNHITQPDLISSIDGSWRSGNSVMTIKTPPPYGVYAPKIRWADSRVCYNMRGPFLVGRRYRPACTDENGQERGNGILGLTITDPDHIRIDLIDVKSNEFRDIVGPYTRCSDVNCSTQ